MRTEATTQAAATQREKEDVARQARDRAAPEQAEHFRAVLDGSAPRAPTDADGAGSRRDNGASAHGDAAYVQAHRSAMVATTTSGEGGGGGPAASAPAAAALIERHAQRLLSSEGARSGEVGSRVMLHLSGTELSGTELWLTREHGGWTLQAEVDDERSAFLLHKFAPDLVARFDEAALGKLEVRVALRGG